MRRISGYIVGIILVLVMGGEVHNLKTDSIADFFHFKF